MLLWNLVPTPPRRDGVAHSNRPPATNDLRDGEAWVRRLLDAVQPVHIGAIGRHAAAALGGDATGAVRHPAHGGAVACSEGLRALLTDWLGVPEKQQPITARWAAAVR